MMLICPGMLPVSMFVVVPVVFIITFFFIFYIVISIPAIYAILYLSYWHLLYAVVLERLFQYILNDYDTFNYYLKNLIEYLTDNKAFAVFIGDPRLNGAVFLIGIKNITI